MKFSGILAASKREKKRQDFLHTVLSRKDWLSYIRYLFYRSRYPISFRVIARIVLLFELYLLSRKIPGAFFLETSFFVFILFQCRSLLRGAMGYSRNKLFSFSESLKHPQANTEFRQSLTILLKLSAATTFITALIMLLLYRGSVLQIAYVAGMLILVPLDAVAGYMWAVVYLKHRLRRGMLLVVCLRFLPLSYLLLVHHPDAIVYITTMITSRALEKVYLISLAAKSLLTRKYIDTLKPLKSGLLGLLRSNPLFRKYLLFSASLPAYELGTGLLLYLRSKDYWIIYLSLSLFMGLLTYFTLQPARVQAFDMYKALKSGLLHVATFLWHRILIASSLIALFLSISIVATTVFLPGNFFIPQKFYGIVLYLSFLLLLRTQILAAMTTIQSLTLERFFYKPMSIFYGLGLLSQFCVIILLRGNLQFCLLTECIISLLLLLAISVESLFPYSTIYRHAVHIRSRVKVLLRPAAWSACAQKLTNKRTHNIWLGELDPRHDNSTDLQSVFADKQIAALRVYGRIFLLLIPAEKSLPFLFRWLEQINIEDPRVTANKVCSLITRNSLKFGKTGKWAAILINANQSEQADKQDYKNFHKLIYIDQSKIYGGSIKIRNNIFNACLLRNKSHELIYDIPGLASVFEIQDRHRFISVRHLSGTGVAAIKSGCIIKSFVNLFNSIISDGEINLDLGSKIECRLFVTNQS